MNRNLHARHPSESWGPVPADETKTLDPSFRWGDEKKYLASTPITCFPESRA